MRKLVCSLVFMFSSTLALNAAAAESSVGVLEETSYSRSSFVNVGVDIQFVPIRYKNYQWTDGQTSNETGSGLHLGVEWIPFDERYGKLGFGLGFGFYAIRNVTFNGKRATLTALPLEAYLSYRFDYVEDQILVPFVKVGASGALTKQKGIEVPGMQTYYGFDYSAGLELCLDQIDRSASRHLMMNTGISNTYLAFEYLRSAYLNQHRGPNLTRDEMRIGLRFEM